MIVFVNYIEILYIINIIFCDVFGVMGGGGNIIVLLIVIFIWLKWKDYCEIVILLVVFGLFNINELVVFGFLIVYNLSLMILFIILILFCLCLVYFVIKLYMILEVVVMVLWMILVVVFGFFVIGGDWCVVVF